MRQSVKIGNLSNELLSKFKVNNEFSEAKVSIYILMRVLLIILMSLMFKFWKLGIVRRSHFYIVRRSRLLIRSIRFDRSHYGIFRSFKSIKFEKLPKFGGKLLIFVSKQERICKVVTSIISERDEMFVWEIFNCLSKDNFDIDEGSHDSSLFLFNFNSISWVKFPIFYGRFFKLFFEIFKKRSSLILQIADAKPVSLLPWNDNF